MFNIGPGELAVILIAALILLGPQRLPEVARTLGKFLREFRRQTDDVRNLVEREFYKMDQDLTEPVDTGNIIHRIGDTGHSSSAPQLGPVAAAPAAPASTEAEAPAGAPGPEPKREG